jgi:phosphoribosyl 1,2-cyclic phosphate phosphodiesterase
MKLIVTGTGTSQGIPMIACDCQVCISQDPRDNRQRTAAILQTETTTVAIDAGPDFRNQLLKARIKTLNAVILTHEHNDHLAGLEDVRPFVYFTGSDMPVFALPRVLGCIEQRFPYAFGIDKYPGAPSYQLNPLENGQTLTIGDITITTLAVEHGNLPILGFRCGDIAYITDAKKLPEASFKLLEGVELLVINALHHDEHPTHMNLIESLNCIDRINPRRAWLTHQSHRMGLHADLALSLPPHIEPAWDGLEIEF